MILVAGGAGYIGSHTNKLLSLAGKETVVFDNLSLGHREHVKWGHFFEGDLCNVTDLRACFKKYKITAVMHFCAYTDVGASVKDPMNYYRNNVANTLNLIQVMQEFGVKHFIFSSTCAVYGVPQKVPLTEDHPKQPVNPYGRSKWMVEQVLSDLSYASDFRYVALRYFNAAGADPDGEIGEKHQPETHLIPLVIQAVLGQRDKINVFGTDYPTPDGTCIRDYIHVNDLGNAHLKALEYLEKGQSSEVFNLGNGQGFSVREIIQIVERVSGKKCPVQEVERREGDPPTLFGSAKKAKKVLGWEPTLGSIEDIVGSAWNYHRNLDR